MFAKVYRKGYLNHICTNTQEGKQWLGTHVYLYAGNVLNQVLMVLSPSDHAVVHLLPYGLVPIPSGECVTSAQWVC